MTITLFTRSNQKGAPIVTAIAMISQPRGGAMKSFHAAMCLRSELVAAWCVRSDLVRSFHPRGAPHPFDHPIGKPSESRAALDSP
jgi:hypothetical protein